MALHEQSVGATDEWYTPPEVFRAMAVRFDLDVAAPRRPCPACDFCDDAFTQDSLTRQWLGFVWMNAPFGARNGLEPWLARFMAHGDGVALVPDRTSASWFQDYCPQADLTLLVRKKLKFISGDGRPNSSPAQGTVLLACGVRGVRALRSAAAAGLGSLWRPEPQRGDGVPVAAQVSQPIRDEP